MALVKDWFFDGDGWSRYPLFHGTSTYFLPSIEKHGLGGRNIIKEMQALEMWRELCRLRNRQPPVAYYEGGSWGYGQVYLTPFKQRALSFRSECILLIRSDLRYMRGNQRQELLNKYPQVAECLAHTHQPVVLRMLRVHQSMLMALGMDDPLVETGDEGEVKNNQNQFSPHPTFRLRTPITDFEVIQSSIEYSTPKRRIKRPDDELWPLHPSNEWILDFLRWAVIPSSSKADYFWKGYIEHTISYVSNSDVNRAFRQLGYVFPRGYKRNDQSSQMVRWKWRSRAHKSFMNALFDNKANHENNDLTKFGELGAEFEKIRAKYTRQWIRYYPVDHIAKPTH